MFRTNNQKKIDKSKINLNFNRISEDSFIDEMFNNIYTSNYLNNKVRNLKKAKEEVNYGMVNYIKYEYANRADHAKKILEKNAVQNFLKEFSFSEKKRISLDIGCATCRYPLWFSTQGFFAKGYDIDDEAIKICEHLSKEDDNIEILKKDILQESPEENEYNIITCMMGTFNHVSKINHKKFLSWIYSSLKSNGAFIFSIWNIECPYTSYLYFYDREEKELIQNNSRELSQIIQLLEDNGFVIKELKNICFLPNECYESWMGNVDEMSILKIDEELNKKLGYKDSQMIVFCAIKS